MLSITMENVQLITVTANVIADLANKEGYIVEQIAASEKVQLYTSGIPYAVLVGHIPDSGQWRAAIIGGGGICPCVAGGVITSPAYVKAASGGKVVAASSTNLCVGTRRAPATAAADNDVIGVDLALVTMP